MATQDYWSSQRAGLDPLNDPHDADDGELEAEWEEPSYKDMILFCIDGGDSMYEINPTTGRTYIDQALEGAFKVYDRKMITSPGDYVGVMIFGTGKSDIPDDRNARFQPHCVLYIPLAQVGIRSRMELKIGLAEARNNSNFWSDKFGKLQTRRAFPPSYAIQNASWIFRHAGKSGTKRVFWVTNNDNPDPTGKPTQLQIALESLRDAKRVGIEFVPFLISPEGHKFDTDRFYGDLFDAYDDEFPDLNRDAQTERKLRIDSRPKWDWEVAAAEFDSEVMIQETPKRTVFSVPFHIGEGFTIGVKGYLYTHPAKRAPGGWFYQDEDGMPHEMVSIKQCLDFETGRNLGPQDRVRAFTFSNGPAQDQTRVQLSNEEYTQARTMGLTPSLRLLGTLPRDWLKPYYQVTNPHFLYPNDQEYVGSRKAFAAFLGSLLKHDKLAIGLLMPRNNANPYYVALLPQEEQLDSRGDQLRAPGLVVIRLPFTDDLRDPPVMDQLTADEKEVEAAKALIHRYIPKRPYDPYDFSNPALAMHFAVLQRAAYDETEEEIPDPIDSTIPKYYEIKERCANQIIHLNKLVAEDDRAVLFMSSEPAAIEVDESRVLEFWRNNSLQSLKVNELKAVCAKLQVAAGNRKKADLVVFVHNAIMLAYPELTKEWNIGPKEV